MSFNRPTYDTCSYKQTLAESVGPGDYQINRPVVSCMPCLPNDPYLRLQRQGVSVSQNTPLIDVDSELIGIGRNYSRCPEKKYIPQCNANAGCGANGIGSNVKNSAIKMDYNLVHFGDCFTATEDTRLSNPPCTLREIGFNRWEWLPSNPQERVEVPFDWHIDTAQMSKDNHRPCIAKPLDQWSVYPEANDKPIQHTIIKTCAVPSGPPGVQWKPASEIANLVNPRC